MKSTNNNDTISVSQQNVNGDNNAEIKKGANLSKQDSGDSTPARKEGVNYLKILIVVFIGAVVFWALSLFSYFTFGFAISETGIILTFVGILTTFILISNYAQVKEIKDKFEQDKCELYNRMEAIEKETAKLAAKVDVAKLRGEVYRASNDFREYTDASINRNRKIKR